MLGQWLGEVMAIGAGVLGMPSDTSSAVARHIDGSSDVFLRMHCVEDCLLLPSGSTAAAEGSSLQPVALRLTNRDRVPGS